MSEDPLERLAAEEDWQKRARKVRGQVGRQRWRRSSRNWSVPKVRTGGISWIFLALLALTFVSGVLLWMEIGPASANVFVFVLCGWLVTLCLHEFAHALTAHRGGDDTIEGKGYLTLDPRKYGHPLLTFVLPIIFLLIGGLPLPGGAVNVETHRLRNRFQDSLVSAAGPAINIVFSIVLLTVLAIFGPPFAFSFALIPPHAAFWAALTFLAFLQVASSILNLLPVPGLDGYGIIDPYLPASIRRVGNALKPYGLLLLFVLLYLPILRGTISTASNFILDAAGAPFNGVAYGYQLFRFWGDWL